MSRHCRTGDSSGSSARTTGDSKLSSLSDVQKNLALPNLREELLTSNWGTMVAAVEHHALALEHCWMVCTKGTRGSSAQFEVAEQVVKRFSNAEVKCHLVELADANDIGTMMPTLAQVFQDALDKNLEPGEIIADFTGGTAAMSGALILATIEKDRKIEYLRQDRALVSGDVALTKEQILEQKILVEVRTSPALVPTVTT